MCRQCRIDPLIPFLRASVFDAAPPAFHLVRARPDLLADFAVRAWSGLAWPLPDAVVPMRGAKELALRFAELIERPFVPLFKRSGCDAEAIESDRVLLVIDRGNSFPDCQIAIEALAETFPKKGYLLSLFPYDSPDS